MLRHLYGVVLVVVDGRYRHLLMRLLILPPQPVLVGAQRCIHGKLHGNALSNDSYSPAIGIV